MVWENADKCEDDDCTCKVIVKTLSLEEINAKLEAEKLKKELEQCFLGIY